MKSARLVLFFVIALTLVRVAMVWLQNPSPDEAYYYLCAQHPAPAYFDGPPATAFQVGLINGVSGGDFFWRATAPAWAMAASILCFLFVRRLSNESVASISVVVLNLLPGFNVQALRVGPQLPALALLILCLLWVWMAFEAEKNSLLWWALSGVALGGACLYSYAAIFVIPLVIIFVLSSARHRRGRDLGGLVIWIVLPAAFLFPALIWNARQEWIPMMPGTLRSLWHFDSGGFLASLVSLLYFISPLVAVTLLGTWAMLAGGAQSHIRARFLFLAAMPFVVLSFYMLYHGGDAAFFFLLAVPLLLVRARDFLDLIPAGRWAGGTAIALALGFSLHAAAASMDDGRAWDAAAAHARDVFMEELKKGNESLFLVAENPALASVLGYYLKDSLIPPAGHPVVYVGESQDISSQYALWPTYADFVDSTRVADEYYTEQKGENPFIGRSALYITEEKADEVPQTIKAAFESVTLLEEYPLRGAHRNPLYIYLCKNYQTLPL